jgi:hypothetical protein
MNSSNGRLEDLTPSRLVLSQPGARASTVGVDELDAGGIKGPPYG